MKTQMQKLTATLPDGRIVARLTAHPYKYVVAQRVTGGTDVPSNITLNEWYDIYWTSTLDYAEKHVRGIQSYPVVKRGQLIIENKIVPVV